MQDIHPTLRVRRVINFARHEIRPVFKTEPPRAELEISTFGREYFVKNRGNTISMPLILFIDGFGLYRNMYRSITGIYFTPASLKLEQRNRRQNVFTLTLGSHSSDLSEILRAIDGLTELDKGIDMEIDGVVKHVCAYVHVLVGDMPQQNQNSGLKNQNANRGCRYCLCPQKDKADLHYDIVLNGRFHHHMKALREASKAMPKGQYKKFCTEWGLAETPTALIDLLPALPSIDSRALDG